MIPVSQSVVYDCSVVPTCANVQCGCESAARLVALHFVPVVWSGLFGMFVHLDRSLDAARATATTPHCLQTPLRTKERPLEELRSDQIDQSAAKARPCLD